MQKLQDLNPLHERFGSLSLVAVGAVVLLLGLLLRSDLFLSIVGTVLEITGWVGVIGGVVLAAAGVVAYGQVLPTGHSVPGHLPPSGAVLGCIGYGSEYG